MGAPTNQVQKRRMKLRIRWPEGSSTVTLSGEELTLNSLRSSIEEASSIPAQLQQISCGFPPVKLETETDGSTLLANIGIRKGDQITVERSVAKRLRPNVDCPFSAGQIVLYLPTQEPVTIIKVHLDDPAELYITVQMPDGREKQNVLNKLTPAPAASVSGLQLFDQLAAAPTPADWSCEICTLLNSSGATRCGACDTAKPGGAVVAAAASGGGIVRAELKKMPDDNSCLFHGINHLLDPNTNAEQMRNVVATAVTMNPIMWNQGTLGKEPQEYIRFITDRTRW